MPIASALSAFSQPAARDAGGDWIEPSQAGEPQGSRIRCVPEGAIFDGVKTFQIPGL